jgi:DNA-directed RNA polymerase specialized sigma24 family protein
VNQDLDIHLASIVAGDRRAFAAWLGGAEASVRDSLRSFASVIDVEAVLQESLLRVWQVAPRFEPDGRPNGLLRLGVRIARNLAVSEVRRTKATPVAPPKLDELENTAAPAVSDPLLREAIIDCRSKLPPKPRQALDSRLASGGAQDDAELAEAVGMRLNTFLQNFTRARALLADCLKKRGIVFEGLL